MTGPRIFKQQGMLLHGATAIGYSPAGVDELVGSYGDHSDQRITFGQAQDGGNGDNVVFGTFHDPTSGSISIWNDPSILPGESNTWIQVVGFSSGVEGVVDEIMQDMDLRAHGQGSPALALLDVHSALYATENFLQALPDIYRERCYLMINQILDSHFLPGEMVDLDPQDPITYASEKGLDLAQYVLHSVKYSTDGSVNDDVNLLVYLGLTGLEVSLPQNTEHLVGLKSDISTGMGKNIIRSTASGIALVRK